MLSGWMVILFHEKINYFYGSVSPRRSVEPRKIERILALLVPTFSVGKKFTASTFPVKWRSSIKADFQSVEFSERAEILLFERENVALKLNG